MSNVTKKVIWWKWVLNAFPVTLAVLIVLPLAAQTASGKRTQVEIRTELGTMIVELYNETPIHRDNFIALVKSGAYDSLLFHRVVPGFMILGGDPESRNAKAGVLLGEKDETTKLPAEIVPGLMHKRGALAAFRPGDDVDPEKRSSGSQFYIVQGRTYAEEDLQRLEDRSARYGTPHKFSEAEKTVYSTLGGAPHLDGSYTVFGQVTQGIEVLDAITALPLDVNDRPVKDVRMFMRIK